MITLRCQQTRTGVALVLALGVLAVIAGLVMLSLTSATQTFTQTNRSIHQQSALAAVDAVLSRRETRLSNLALTGNASSFRNWRSLGLEAEVPKDPVGKNYGEDIVGDFRVRWRVEPLVVKSPDPITKAYITNPVPSEDETAYDPALVPKNSDNSVKRKDNDYTFLYRLAAEAVLYQNPNDPKLNDPGNPAYNVPGYPDNPILARAQGVRFVGADNIPLFRYVIFYAQRGPKGDLELTHGGTVKVKGDVHSNGAIYLGGNTNALDWNGLSSGSASQLGPTLGKNGVDDSSGATIAGDDRPVSVVGVDGIFMLSKAGAYSAFNWTPYMVPVTSADTSWSSSGSYHLGSHPVAGQTFPLDDSSYYVDVKTNPGLLATFAQATSNGTRLSPYRITDSSKLVTTDSNRQINKVTITGSSGGSTATNANDARDAFRQPTGQSWKTHSDTTFARSARTKESGGREVKLDKSLIGRPLEAQQLAYIDNPNTTIDESTSEDHAVPVFRDDGVTTPTANPTPNDPSKATVREAAGYYLALAMGAGDGDRTAYSERYNASTVLGSVTPGPMTGWILNAGAAPIADNKVGLVIRERYRPRFDLWGQGENGNTEATPVMPTSEEFKPYAYGKHYYPVPPNPFVPVLVGNPALTGCTQRGIDLRPDWNTITYAEGKLTVVSSSEDGNWSNLSTTLSQTGFHDTPRKIVHVPPTPTSLSTDLDKLESVAVRIANPAGLTGADQRNVGLVIMPGEVAHTNVTDAYLDASVATSDSVFTLNSLVNIQPGTLLVVNGIEMVRVIRVGPDTTYSPNLSANQIQVARRVGNGNPGSNPTHPRYSSVVCTAVQPVACRLTAYVNNTDTTSTLSIDKDPTAAPGSADYILLEKGQLLRMGTEVVRITNVGSAVGANKITVLRHTDESQGKTVHHIGTPLHWQGRSAFLTLGYADRRSNVSGTRRPSVFVQIRRRPSETVATALTGWWNGNGTASTLDSAYVASAAPDSTVTLALATCTQTVDPNTYNYDPGNASNKVRAMDNPNNTLKDLGATADTARYPDFTARGEAVYTWSGESNTYTLKRYGRQRMERTEWYPARKRWTLTMTLKPTTLEDANIGFWDPTRLSWDNYGDIGRTLYLYTTTSSTALNLEYVNTGNYSTYSLSNNIQLYSLNPATALPTADHFGQGTRYQDTETLRPACPTDMTDGETRTGTGYNHSRLVWGEYDETNKRMTVHDVTPALPWLGVAGSRYYVVGSGPLAGWTLLEAPSRPTPTDPAGQMSAPTVSPFRYIIGSVATPDDTSGNSADRRFCVQRNSTAVDNNGFITRAGTWNDAEDWVQTLPPAAAAATTCSYRPDMWHGKDTNVPPSPTATSSSTYVTTDGGAFYNNALGYDDKMYSSASAPAHVWLALRVVTNGSGKKVVRFRYYWGATAPATTDGSGAEWLPIYQAEPNQTVEVEVPLDDFKRYSNKAIIGLSVQSASSNWTTTAQFSDYSMKLNDGTTVTFDSLAGSANASNYTKYLRSQYQVWWGTRDITDHFFSYNESITANRLATEDWFYQPREFWSQSRWFNEDAEQPPRTDGATTATSVDDTSGKTLLIEKDPAGNPGSGSADNPNNRAYIDNRRYWAKTTVLTLNLRMVQDYINTVTLRTATGNVADPDTTLATLFNGLIYAARTNRAPWVPDLNSYKSLGAPATYPPPTHDLGLLLDSTNRCWLSSFYDYGSNLVAASGKLDNYDNFRQNPAAGRDPWVRGDLVYGGTLANPGATGSAPPGGAVPDTFAQYLVPNISPYKDMVTPRIRCQDFHHGIRIKNGAAIDWNYGASKVFGNTKLSVVTPNQLYIWGNFNLPTNTFTPSYKVKMPDKTDQYRPAPVAVMGDVVTLLSNSFSDANFKRPKLTVDTRRVVKDEGTLSDTNGPAASATTYNACILTHNLPTTKASTRLGEASSFVNTMMFLEDWNGRAMTYSGSLVVMNSRRYSKGYLLEQPKVFGRTPFGWAGWVARNDSAAIERPDGSYVNGTGYLDWIHYDTSSRAAKTGAELVPSLWPSGVGTGGPRTAQNDTSAKDGIPPVYFQPDRILSFNDDLLSAEGTPPFTPFGQTVKGLGAWSRVVE